MEVQQVQRHLAKMRRMKQGLMGMLKKRKCTMRNHMCSREEVKKRKNHE
jgi:hypothetical protein